MSMSGCQRSQSAAMYNLRTAIGSVRFLSRRFRRVTPTEEDDEADKDDKDEQVDEDDEADKDDKDDKDEQVDEDEDEKDDGESKINGDEDMSLAAVRTCKSSGS